MTWITDMPGLLATQQCTCTHGGCGNDWTGWRHAYGCPFYSPVTFTPMTTTQTHYHFTPRLTDDDVERIAKRVAELIKEK